MADQIEFPFKVGDKSLKIISNFGGKSDKWTAGNNRSFTFYTTYHLRIMLPTYLLGKQGKEGI